MCHALYSRRSMYNQREKYNQWGFRHHFYRVNTKFSTFFFLRLKLRTICYKKQEKKVRKILLERWKIKFIKIKFFFHRRFLPPFSLAADNFRRIQNHILIGPYVQNTAFKNQGGYGETFLNYSAWEELVPVFPKILVLKV